MGTRAPLERETIVFHSQAGNGIGGCELTVPVGVSTTFT
jgi:hypothetical protein